MRHRHPFIAAIYDRMCASQERAFLSALRTEVVGRALGTVIEVGAGTGLNFSHYGWSGIGRLQAIEPDPHMRRHAEARARVAHGPIEWIDGTAECLPFEDGHADSVVMTLVLCSVTDPQQAAREIRRVLKPSGSLFFIEHVRSEEPWRARLQDLVTPVWHRIAGNCHANRASLRLLRDTGFVVQETRRVPGAGPFGNPIVAGVARVARADI
jgi:ubiquinone/menaquinone biosynthesis C-methylase UbiE